MLEQTRRFVGSKLHKERLILYLKYRMMRVQKACLRKENLVINGRIYQ
jgi:hypothetical protein